MLDFGHLLPNIMQDRLAKELINIGFTDKEAKVYLGALELGAATAQQIAAKATVNRPTTYVAIESLIKRGLMSSIQKGKKRFFVAEPPENLQSVLRKQREDLKTKEEKVNNIMGELHLLSIHSDERPQVLFYEGKEGIERMRENLKINKNTDVVEFSFIDVAYKNFPPAADDHRQWFRQNKNIRLIYASKKGIVLPEVDGKVVRRRISYEEYPFDGDMCVDGDMVCMVHDNPLMGVQIVHKGLARTFTRMFNLAWRALEMQPAK